MEKKGFTQPEKLEMEIPYSLIVNETQGFPGYNILLQNIADSDCDPPKDCVKIGMHTKVGHLSIK